MLVLFDQGTPVPIANSLLGHSVKTARQLGWDTLANGELLRAAEEAGFDVLLTTDKNLAYQQNLKDRKLAIVVLGRNRWSLIRAVLPQIAAAVNGADPGSYVIVDVPEE
jgi:glutamate racemase